MNIKKWIELTPMVNTSIKKKEMGCGSWCILLFSWRQAYNNYSRELLKLIYLRWGGGEIRLEFVIGFSVLPFRFEVGR